MSLIRELTRKPWLADEGTVTEFRGGRAFPLPSEKIGLRVFLAVVAEVITGRSMDIDYVDMRYNNGFTIGWKGGISPHAEPQTEAPEMLASRGTQ